MSSEYSTASGNDKKQASLSLIITVIYTALLGSFKFIFHELWKDEWQAWLLATDTKSLSELFHMLPLEGHPPLWFLLLRFCHYPFSVMGSGFPEDVQLQGIHLLLVGIAVFVFVRYLRLPLWLKLLFLMSYFFCFEYGVINRGYVLVMILSFFVAHKLSDLSKPDIWTMLAILALCLSEVYGIFIAFGFLLFLLIHNKKNPLKIWPVFASLIIGLILFLLSIISPDAANDYSLHQFNSFQFEDITKAFQSVMVNALLPGIAPTVYHGISTKGLVISGGLLVWTVLLFWRNKAVLLAWIAFCLSMLMFTAFFYMGSPRNWGMVLIFFVCMLHLMAFSPGEYLRSIKLILITGSIVLVQMIHNIRILYRDYREPFSNAKEAGNYIASHIKPGVPILAINKFSCTPVSGYAMRPLHSLPDGKPFTFFKWREKLFIPGTSNLIQMRRKFHADEIYVLSYKALKTSKYPGIKSVRMFDRPNIRGEYYYLYRY